MRLTIATAFLCTAMAFGARAGGGGKADTGPWQWETGMTFPAAPPMTGSDMKGHMGDVVYAADGAPVGTLDSYTTDDDAVVHASMFFTGGMMYLIIPGKDLAAMNGKLYVHGVDMMKVKMTMHPEHLAVGL